MVGPTFLGVNPYFSGVNAIEFLKSSGLRRKDKSSVEGWEGGGGGGFEGGDTDIKCNSPL